MTRYYYPPRPAAPEVRVLADNMSVRTDCNGCAVHVGGAIILIYGEKITIGNPPAEGIVIIPSTRGASVSPVRLALARYYGAKIPWDVDRIERAAYA